MRWKLKDLLAESVHPVPEKAALRTFVMRKPQDLAWVKKNCDNINESPPKQKL